MLFSLTVFYTIYCQCYIGVVNKSLDELVSNAIYLCKDHEEVSPAMFQRTLSVDFITGKKVFEELHKLGIICEVKVNILDDDEENPLGTIDKTKLKEFLLN